MHLRGRGLKFTAVTAMVVLALTGFSTGRGHGTKHDSDGSGGGCSSSSQDHDSSSSTSGGSSSGSGSYHDDDDYDDTSGSGSSSGETATTADAADVEVVECATKDDPAAKFDVTNRNDRDGTFKVDIAFKDASGATVEERGMEVEVAAGSTVTVGMKLSSADAAKVAHCDADPVAPPV
ncbi:hypothetical protein [Streptomyces sp. HUAS ZL42]|uniref:hypothetical protein n=1 Tax=Streptomyces sp. HUAS ZL42 TaxID=3231715 RepID=UPI00345E554F